MLAASGGGSGTGTGTGAARRPACGQRNGSAASALTRAPQPAQQSQGRGLITRPARRCARSSRESWRPTGAGSDPAPDVLIDLHSDHPGPDRVHDVLLDPRGEAFAERALIAIRPEI